MNKILIIVDMQNDFCGENGSLTTEQAKAIVPKVKAKIDEYMEWGGYKFIFTMDTHYDNEHNFLIDKDAHERIFKKHKLYHETQEGKNLPVPHCIVGTEGWEMVDNIDCVKDKDGNVKNKYDFMPNAIHIIKCTFGWKDWESSISERLLINKDGSQIGIDEISEIEIIGLCTDVCVVTNALILKTIYPEVKITVDASCCAGITEESHKAALLTMKMCQINVINE